MKKPVFTGAAVAIITPFKSTGEVDYEEFGKIIDHQIAHGTDAIVVCGTTGEASALHDKEHREALAWCCEYVNHRVPVVAGTGSNDTAYALSLIHISIGMVQDTLNIRTGKVEPLSIHGRHDPCIVTRAAPVVEAACAVALADLLREAKGYHA